MLIICPKCKCVYEISSDIVLVDGQKMSCSHCGENFLFNRQDALTEQFIDVENIINKQEKNQGSFISLPYILAHNSQFKKYFYKICEVFCVMFLLLSMFFLRFEITRVMPFMENVYSIFGIRSIYFGRNLEFINIQKTEYVEDNIGKLQIIGDIYNTGKYTVTVPNINLQILDSRGNIVLYEKHEIELNRLQPEEILSFKIITTNPTPLAKSIYLTFAEK